VLARRDSAGVAAGLVRLRVEREAIYVDAVLSGEAARRGRAQALVAGYLSGPVNPSEIEAVRPERSRAPIPSVEELVASAGATRGEFIALQRELEAARFAERAAERLRIPEPEVTAGTKSSNFGFGDVGSVFSVHVSVPLFDRAAPERAAAQARASQIRIEMEALRRVVRAEVAVWRATVIERRSAADRYRDSVVNADQVERIAQVSYDAGERGILELIDAHRLASDARTRLHVLEAMAREAEIELEFASGWELP
jgi:cobalt-zinc-cadmium efflux system outer membrane protein